ncbi:MAG: IscS subfamily cysteine desulfurase [Sphingomonadales bacterium]
MDRREHFPEAGVGAEGGGAADQLEWRSTICGICPAGCWVEAGMRAGKLEKLRADENHTLGMICRRGLHAPEIVYSEHRLKYPMRRTGPKGTHEFERITWDQAYDIIAENLDRIKRESGPEAVSIYTGRGAFELSLCDMYQPKGVAPSSASNILFPFGSPNTMGVGALCYVSFAMIAPHVTMGRMLPDMFTDMENAELLVVWGANPATDSPPLDMHRLEAAAARGAEIVVIDPRRTETVERTGASWLPIRPGTDCALALGLIEVMIAEELYDIPFAKDWCHGFDDLKTYVQHFTPEVVAPVTGIEPAVIRDLARRICRANGACPVMYTGLEYSNSGVQAIRAVLTLFALAGQLDVPGGIGLAMLDAQFPINRSCNQPNPNLAKAVARDRFPLYSHYRGESHALGLIDAVLKGEPYAIRGLIVHGASILTSWPQTPIWRETLSKLDFMVCIDRQMTADAAFADIVLPATTGFEIDAYQVYGPIFRLREKLIEPVGEARNDYLIMAHLAERLGYGELYPQSEEAMIRFALEGSGHSLEEVRAAGGFVKRPTGIMAYKKWQKGGLRRDGKPGFDTPTGKFEIFATTLADYGYEPLPKYVEPREGPLASPEVAADFPLVFNSGARPQTDFRSQHHGVRGLCTDNPEPVAELNTRDAKARGIETGDLVEVATPRGTVPFRARVTDDIVAGAIECNMGGGTPVGPEAWREWNVNLLTDIANVDEISGFPVYKSLLCEVTKLEAGTAETKIVAGRKPRAIGSLISKGTKKIASGRRIYLDNSATTPAAASVREAMSPYLDAVHGNPSSIHRLGRDAREAISSARRQIASMINARPSEIVFTGGGSEADNLAIKGVAFKYWPGAVHIVTSAIEHPAVLRVCAFLKRLGFGVTCLPVNGDGLVRPGDLRRAITDKTVLVSVMTANNEVGSLQPIAELAAIARDAGALFHTDAVQAIGKIPVDVEALGVDLLSLSGHKFHGPKGVGALYVRRDVSLEPVIHGGGQEGGLRAGTENVAAIAGIGKAAEIAAKSLDAANRMAELRDRLEAGVRKLVPEARFNGSREQRLPNVLNMTLPGLRGESVAVALDQHGVSLSSGSACKTGSPEPTHVLLAMGRSEQDAHCAVRFSLSHLTTAEDIEDTLERLTHVLNEMATTVRFLSCK